MGGLEWRRWQTAVCCLIVVCPGIGAAAAVVVRRRKRGAASPSPSPSPCGGWAPAWAPCFRGVAPAAVAVYRGLVAGGMSCVLYAMLRRRGLLEFYFYTQWTFLLVILYFLIGTFLSAHACWLHSRHKPTQDVEAPTIGFLTIYTHDSADNRTALVTPETNTAHKLHAITVVPLASSLQIIYQICGGAVMLTDVVFWCILVPFMSSAHFSVNLLMGCMHSLNLLFLLVDTCLNSMPFSWFGMTYFILWSCTYVIFQWILHACGFSWWPYPFLELATPWAPLWYFCMALVHVPCYGIYWLIVKAKDTYFPRLFPHSYVTVRL